jgi:endonuclease/exonuclease/phosphatase (EEP) superfamily protein YafD
MIRRVLAAALLLVIAAILLIAAWPQLFGLEHSDIVAQIVSLRAAAAVGAAVVVVLLLLVALASRVARRLAASVAVLLLAFAGLNLAILADRGFGDIAFETTADMDITVLSWNTLGDAPGAEVVADLALEAGADVVTLPESTAALGTSVAAIMGAAGHPMQPLTVAFDQISKARSTTVLISEALGAYAIDDSVGSTSQLPSVVARPVNGTGPTIIAVHAVAPSTADLDGWVSDQQWLAATCIGENTIMAGDFNSTLDHFAHLDHANGATLGDCTDAALASGNAAVGTWPTTIPALLGTPIDHVMTTANWRVSGMRVIESQDDAGSDHRPIVAQLSPAKG